MQKRHITILFTFLLLFTTAYSQKIGLVLSGGGAKGMAHLGVIQALEDNGIPIDYITGTSIGAIVGGMYAMGYSPQNMLEVFKSKDFAYWQSGEIQENYIYSYKRKDPAADIFTIKFGIRDSLIIQPRYLPSSMINPNQMNIAFLSLFAQATAVCEENFDNLFVPFRCVASDVYRKKPVVLKSGDLGDAIRASMTFPFVFKPIEIDKMLLFDGGIYDNFPINVMKKDFDPDYIIGISVASNPNKPKALDIMSQMENMVMQHTDYSVESNEGILIDFHFDNVKLLDFNKADELFKLGYDKAMKHIEEIKQKTKQRITKEELTEKRNIYKAKLPELKFKNIKVNGINPDQQKYILKSFLEDHEYITLNQLKESYFKLLTDNRISEIYPHAIYNTNTGYFDLMLDVTLEENFLFSIGGNVSSSVSSQAYFSINYQLLKAVGLDFDLNAQFGKVYNTLQLSSQVDFPSTKFPFYLKLIGNMHGFNYYEGNEAFFEDNSAIYAEKDEKFAKFEWGFPTSMKSKLGIGTGYGVLNDYYYQSPDNFAQNNKDQSKYLLLDIYGRYLINTLNDKQYANKGIYCNITGQFVFGQEKYFSSTDVSDNTSDYTNWLQAQGEYQKYYPLGHHFTLGIQADAAWSFRPLCNNYTATILQAPSFTPTTHSKYTFNEAFVANQFVAGGIKPIYNITRQLSIRSEFYAFVPLFPIEKDGFTGVEYGKLFSSFQYMGEISVVFRLPFIAISVFGNGYSAPAKNWNVGFNIGYLIFNRKFLE